MTALHHRRMPGRGRRRARPATLSACGYVSSQPVSKSAVSRRLNIFARIRAAAFRKRLTGERLPNFKPSHYLRTRWKHLCTVIQSGVKLWDSYSRHRFSRPPAAIAQRRGGGAARSRGTRSFMGRPWGIVFPARHPRRPPTYYAGAASGGYGKALPAGTRFPFSMIRLQAIGALAVAPTDPGQSDLPGKRGRSD
jgi:hypothetical protein